MNRFPRVDLLSPEAIETIERGWKRLVTELGVELLEEEAREHFRRAGQTVEGTVVKLDPEFLLEQVGKAPSSFEVQARNAEHDLLIGGETMCFVPVYGAPFVVEDGVRRDATIADFHRLVQLAQHFDEIDSPGGVICEPADLPLDSRHLDMVLSHITNSDKPFFSSVISRAGAEDSVRMAEIVFGSREAIEERPAMLSIINANSPLRFDDRMLGSLLVLADARQVCIVTPSTILGAMAPVSIPAALAQSLAEAFTAIALIQLVRPGCPVVWGGNTAVTDMRSGAFSNGAPEPALGILYFAQLARHYALPYRGGGCVTASHALDAQAAYEAMRMGSATFLAGPNVAIHSAGAMSALLAVSFEKFVMDIELLRSLRVQFAPVEIDEASLAFDSHAEAGHGGHFFGTQHTLERFRDCFYTPLLSITDGFERWQRDGARETAARAHDLVGKILDEIEPPPLPDPVAAELGEYVARRRRELGD
jgi:trimethylamine--corrinoid protein Co-methyltransferase